MENGEIAEKLTRISVLLEAKGEIRFKVAAYQKASQAVENSPRPLSQLYAEGGLKALMQIPGIGEGIARKIEEYIKTGGLKYHDELKKSLPPGIEELLEIPHLGPKTAILLATRLGVKSADELAAALRAGKARDLPRMGEKIEEKLLKGIEIYREGRGRMLLGSALPLALRILAWLTEEPSVKTAAYAGSLRRMKETVGDLDFLVAPKDPRNSDAVMEAFTGMPLVGEVVMRGRTKSQVRLKDGLEADLRVVAPSSFGAALHYFTGSKAHNIMIRELGIKKGLKINEYGVFRGDKKVAGETEEGLFRALGLPFIPPEIREGTGEIEAALKGNLPRLLRDADIRGDFHVHSSWSGGTETIARIAARAQEMGYEYLAVSDHSRAVRIAGGLGIEELQKKNREIDALNKKLGNLRILKGAEVDILKDGSLDYPDSVLAELDVVIASVHSGFNLDEAAQTKRIIKALGNRHVLILGHPTGRLLSAREAYPVNLHEVIKAARNLGKCLELNAQTDRLDLSEAPLREAKEAGVTIAVDSDSHNLPTLNLLSLFGVPMARRGWLEPGDVLNARPLKELLARLERG